MESGAKHLFSDSSLSYLQDSIGQAILETCRVIPDGVLCFMPSYSLMDRLVLRWKVSR
jgi:Fanconi anemia group J protein